MPTVADVIRSVMPQAVALGPAGQGGDRSVSWVRVMRARVPAFDALEAGDLVIVPEGALAPIVHEPAEAEHVVEGLRRAAVAAVVMLPQAEGTTRPVGPPVGWSEAASAFIDGVVAAQVPAFRLVGADESALERAVIGYLVNERAELDRQVTRLESDLQAIALAGDGLAAMAAAIAGFFRRAVAIEDADGTIVALHVPPGSAPATLAAARYETRRGPVALERDLPGGGRFAILGDRPASQLEEAAAERIAVLLALAARDSALRRTRDRGAEALPATGPPWVVVMARQVSPGEELSLTEREERRERVRHLAPARRLLLRGDASSIELRGVAACVPDDPLGLDIGARMARLLGRPVAISHPFDDAGARPAADAEARALLEAGDALAVVQAPPPVLRADRLAQYRLLGSLHNLPDGERHARELLAPLMTGSVRTRAERLATLRAILDAAGPADAAAALGVHRNTVAYRLRGIEAMTGWDLHDPDLRFALALALRIVRNRQRGD